MLAVANGRSPIVAVRAAVAPLLVAALAIALWWIGDRLIQIGPLDRGTFTFFVAIPLWVLAPAAAGLGGRAFEDHVDRGPAAFGGLVVGGIASAVLWSDAVNVDCAPTHTPIELILPALIMGLVIGGGFAVGCWRALAHASVGHHWRAVVFGSIPQLVTLASAPALATYLFFGLCQRP